MRPSRPAAFAVVFGCLAAVGCLGPDKQKEPLVIGNDARGVLGAANTPSRSVVKPAAFDPSNSGGSGLSVQNSFNRTIPGPGTGSSTGGVASRLPPPQVGLPPAVNTPTLAGASYGEPSPEQGRTSMTRAASPPALPAPPAPPAEGSLATRPQPNLEMPLNEPPVKPVVMKEPEVIRPVMPKELDSPTGIRPVMPADPDRAPLPAPVMPSVTPIAPVAPPAAAMPSVTPIAPVTPITPVAPPVPLPPAPPAAPGSAANDPLPVPPAYVPSPTEVPIPGVQAIPKLPPAPPIRPQ
jgi:hypothetical protein